eukprot:g16896.t1
MMAASERRLPSPEAFVGQSWSSWIERAEALRLSDGECVRYTAGEALVRLGEATVPLTVQQRAPGKRSERTTCGRPPPAQRAAGPSAAGSRHRAEGAGLPQGPSDGRRGAGLPQGPSGGGGLGLGFCG